MTKIAAQGVSLNIRQLRTKGLVTASVLVLASLPTMAQAETEASESQLLPADPVISLSGNIVSDRAVSITSYASAATVSALQQENETDEQVSDPQADGDAGPGIVVTGTRIEGVPPSSPLTSIDREEIDARGLTSVEDIIRYLPQNFSSTNTGGAIDQRRPRFSDGATTVNLRGLGEGSTLVLVNGSRISTSPAENGTFTDISTIPFGAIERVEVLTDGASAIYGSDAVGGVINFILKRNYSGLQARARYENSSTDADRYVAEVTGGFTWDNGSITGSVTYTKDEPADRFKAGLSLSNDFRAQGGRFVGEGNGQPGVLAAFAARPPDFIPSIPGALPGSLFAILPAGDGTAINPADIQYVSIADFINQTGNFFLLPTEVAADPLFLTPKSEQISTYLNFSQDITDTLRVNLSGLYSKRDSESRSIALFTRALVPPTNFYSNLNGFVGQVVSNYGFFAETAAGALPPAVGESNTERFNINGELTWDMPIGDWQAKAGFGIGEDEISSSSLVIDVRSPEVLAALASPDQATALNLFGDGSVQRDNLEELITFDDAGSRVGEQDIFSLNLSGTLFELPGGGAKMSLGGESRSDKADFSGSRIQPVAGNDPDFGDFVPEARNKAAFAELFIPIVSPAMDVSGIADLSISVAGRYDEYKITGPFEGTANPFSDRTFDAFVPKIGVVWTPVRGLKFRGTWGEAFQAPTLTELFDPATIPTPAGFVLDPLNPDSNGGPNVPVPILANAGGNADLLPQKSENYTFGVDLSPTLIPGLAASVTWNRTEFSDRISSLAEAFGINSPIPLLNADQFPGIITRDANGVLQLFRQFTPINISTRLNESIDFDINYTFDTDIGEWRFGMFGVHTLKQVDTPAEGVDPVSLKATENGPAKWRINWTLDWQLENWTVNGTVNFRDGYSLIDSRAIVADVEGYTTVDMRVGYEFGNSGFRVSAGVNNIFDADFPFVDNGRGVDSAVVDFRRRVFFIDITKEFNFGG